MGPVLTLEDEQIVWTDKSFQMNRSSDVQTGRTNFSTNKSSDICVSGKTHRFFQDDLPIKTNKSTTMWHKINSHQMVKCQTTCPSRRFVYSLMWKRPMFSIFDDFPKISDVFLNIHQNLSKAHMNVGEHSPKISEDYRRLPKTFEVEANMFWWYTNKFKYNLRDKLYVIEINKRISSLLMRRWTTLNVPIVVSYKFF